MTGEMFKPPKADRGEDYWRDRMGTWGRVLGDETYLIRPNYPDFFELKDKIQKIGFKDADVEPFDAYQGPYIDLKGINAGRQPYSPSLNVSKALGSCQIWGTGESDVFRLDCGKRNRELWGSDEPYVGDDEVILDKIEEIKDFF